ncbi:manganese/zinc/iron transport system substrate-binding protein [Anoxybacillus calidus]|uniref:Manganese/zinc/iron transport system substrate-binding protein n=1 Tax=[Anoxybacillus] calidus TaxID=575178 RepID=A0A7V9YXQ5_9BACL|nr:zinc ABC transporter substrate-binding protein [Anoxybacillus calidus]MBA2870300.1 manganese/zinc/iron transport system substrate-binding protein [Anoxybacillus calidus]
MLKKWAIFMMSMLLLLFIGTGCSSSNEAEKQNGKIVVTTTTGQIADIVKNVGGEHVEVTALMGPGVDPHLYQASQGDIQKLSNADMIFYNGLHLEGKMGEIFEKIAKNKPTIAVAEAIPKDKLIKSQSGANAYDPHVWFDIDLWSYAVKEVRDELSKFDPKHQQDYKKNADEYLKSLQDVKAYAQKQIAQIPEQSRVLITAHDAFGYFGRAYGIEVMGLQGLSTDSEYGLKDVQSLVQTIVSRNIKAVFIESSISEKSIKAVVEGAKKRNHTVTIGGQLFSDAMGEEGTKEGTYIGMYKHNIDTIVSALK